MNIHDAFRDSNLVHGIFEEEISNDRYKSVDEMYSEMINTRDSFMPGKLDISSFNIMHVIANFQKNKREIETLSAAMEELKEKKENANKCVTDIFRLHDKIMDLLNGVERMQHHEQAEIEEPYKLYQEALGKALQKRITVCAETEMMQKSDLSNLYDETAAIRTFIVAGVKELMEDEEKMNQNLCPICFDKEVNMCIVPCGHTICSGCSRKLHGRCPTCRGYVREMVKMFL
ncbi:hypothetical protein EBT25_17145 [bacterium]|nr:hypothetical protein [bacterium]